MAKATLNFFLRENSKSAKGGKIPVYLRVIVNRTKTDCRLPLEVNSAQLSLWNNTLMRFQDPKMPANKLLNKLQQQFEELIYRNSHRINEVSAIELRDQLIGTKINGKSSAEVFLNDYYSFTINLKDTLDDSTKAKYKTAIKHFTKCLQYLKKSSVGMNQIDRQIANKFHDYLLSSIPAIEKTPVSEASAAGIIKKVKTIFARAAEEDVINKNPFSGMKLRPKSPPRDKLNSHEIREILSLDLSESVNLMKVRDIFMFSVYTGLAFQDAMTLTPTDLQKWPSGETVLYIQRIKTGVETKQFLIKQALELHAKYSNRIGAQRVLPQITNQQLNMRLKIIKDRLNLSKNLSTHIARHTFRQLLAESGVNDIAAIKSMMGHSRRNDIDAVYHNVTEKQLLDAKEKFQEFINTLFMEK